MVKKFGLIGRGLSHSFSKDYFNKKFEKNNLNNYSYINYDLIKIEEFNQLIKDSEVIGCNVTIPYKRAIIPYLKSISLEASEMGAVNTIKRCKTGDGFVGYNTDCFGFNKALKESFDITKIHKALVLGTGGASRAVAYVLGNNNISYNKASRNPNSLDENVISYDQANEKITTYNLIINTTPLGTFPLNNTFPAIDYKNINSNQFFYDLVYNPEETYFLKQAKKKNATYCNGYQMLVYQADFSWEIWNNPEK